MTEIILDESNTCCGCDALLEAKEMESGICRKCTLEMDMFLDMVNRQRYAGVISR